MNRSKIIALVLISVTVLSLLLAATFAAKRKAEVDRRLALEAQVSKLTSERKALEDSLRESMAKAQEAQMTNENLKTALAQEQLKNQSLTTELEKVTQVNKALEEKISQPSAPASTTANQGTGKRR